MSELRITEFFGHQSGSTSARGDIEASSCGILGGVCRKSLSDGTKSGVCTLRPKSSGTPVICCPYRLYADDYAVLQRIAEQAFGADVRLALNDLSIHDGRTVRVFGKEQGKELRLPGKNQRGAYFVDWILALLDSKGELEEFVAVEVQTIDTTGNYRAEREMLLSGKMLLEPPKITAGFNWENVNKRILPQLIYKGQVLRLERLCKKGLFFVTPTAVTQRIQQRLGEKLRDYPIGQGCITFHSYELDMESALRPWPLKFTGGFTTTVDQVALAFTAPSNLPPAGVYEDAIRRALK